MILLSLSQIKYHEGYIENERKKIATLKQQLDDIYNQKVPLEVTDYVNQVRQSQHQRVLIVLDNYCGSLNPENLIGSDRILYNQLVTLYPKTRLNRIDNLLINYDNYQPKDLRYALKQRVQIEHIIFQKATHVPGLVINEIGESPNPFLNRLMKVNVCVINILKEDR